MTRFLKREVRRAWLPVLVVLLGLTSYARAQDKPNIIMIFTDDQRWDAVGYAGNPAVQTPHLDALARKSLVLDQCFVNTSICAMSRATILAGQYSSRHGITDFYKIFSDEQLQKTVPGRLQQAGYQTAFFGKWGIGETAKSTHEGAKAFDYWAGQPGQTSFFHEADCKWVQYNGFDRGLDDLCDCPADSRKVSGFHNRIGKANLVNPIHTDADAVPIHAKRFLEGRDAKKPFAMFVFFKSPHSPFADWAAETEHLTDDLSMPRPPGATKALAEREPEVVRKSLGAPGGMRLASSDEAFDGHMRDYYRLVSSMDIGVGKIVEQLKRQGLDQNTVILFTSDNGFSVGEHGLIEKWLMYDSTYRVPGLVYDPRRPAPVRSRRLAITSDFSVTMLDIAGLPKPADMTGASLLPLLADVNAPWRDGIYYEHLRHHKLIPETIGVRSDRYKYTRYPESNPPIEQLFDLHADPNEINDLVNVPEHQTVLAELRARCDALKKEVGATGAK